MGELGSFEDMRLLRNARMAMGGAIGMGLLLSVLWILWGIGWISKGALQPAGGLYFFRRVGLLVPHYRQGDAAWGNDLLGPTDGTLGHEGCAISSVAMVLQSYGIDTDPGRL